MSAFERLRQTARLLTASLQPVDDDEARPWLSEAEYTLFRGLARMERQHHLRVMSLLVQQGHTQRALLAAALLHDAGKSRYPFGVWQRVWVGLMKKMMPSAVARWNQAEPYGWRRPFVISAQHPAWSAEMARAIGSDALTVELIRRHQQPVPQPPTTEADHLLLLLQAADDRS